jgi:hypothetical protein
MKIMLVIVVISIAGINTVQAYQTADSFRNPLDNYAVTGYRFGQLESDGTYHSGEDIMASPKTPVYAIANGIVKVSAKDQSSTSGGYGQVIVIEHTLPDGNKVCSIYGHLNKTMYRAPVGTEVIKGVTPIGYVGYKYENGGYGPHLHFGIIKGAYNLEYKGKTSLSGLSKYIKPSDYLNLIRAVNTQDVYRLSNIGKKAKISSADVFNSGGWRWEDIRPVTSSELERHSTFYPQALYFPKGTFIKQSNNPEISIIKEYSDASGRVKNRFCQPFTSWDAFIRAGGKSDLSNVKIVSSEEYNLYTKGN